MFVRESKARRKAARRRLFNKPGFRATSLFGTLGSWGHGRQTGKADLSGLDDNPLSASVYSHQGWGGTTQAVITPLLSAGMLRVLTGGRICEAAFSSFLLLVAAGTHRTGACSCCFLSGESTGKITHSPSTARTCTGHCTLGLQGGKWLGRHLHCSTKQKQNNTFQCEL